jgi:hypothetical protein
MDEQSARDRTLTRIALGNVANKIQKGKTSNTSNKKRHKGTSNKKTATSANTTSTSKSIICYNCGEKDHISPNCPHPKIDKPTEATMKGVWSGHLI